MKPLYKYILTLVLILFCSVLYAQRGLNVQNRINSNVQTRIHGKVVNKATNKTVAAAQKATAKATNAAQSAAYRTTQKTATSQKIKADKPGRMNEIKTANVKPKKN